MKKIKYAIAIVTVITLSFIGFSSFSGPGVETIEINGLTYEVTGEYNGETIVKVYTAVHLGPSGSFGRLGGIADAATNPNFSLKGNYSTYEKARENVLYELNKKKGSNPTFRHNIYYIIEGEAYQSELGKYYVK